MNQIIKLLHEIARTQRQHGLIIEFIAKSLGADPEEKAQLIELTEQMKQSHDLLKAAIDATPPELSS